MGLIQGLSKEEFKSKLDAGDSISKGAFTFYEYEGKYYYICADGTCQDCQENFEDMWDFITIWGFDKVESYDRSKRKAVQVLAS